MVTVGGGYGANVEDGVYRIDSDGARRQVELYDPDTRKWQPRDRRRSRIGATTRRPCCSPTDGSSPAATTSIRSSPTASNSETDTAEIYSPPYLFKGKRPVIKKAPKTVDWKQPMRITTKGKSKATSAVLVAPAATTHGNDMNQRLVPLKVKKQKKKATEEQAPERRRSSERRSCAARLLHALRPQQEGRPVGRQVGQARKLTAAVGRRWAAPGRRPE